MPFVDFNVEIPSFNWRTFEYVIVGAGAAGILLAITLTTNGRRVLLIETGHFALDDQRQVLNEVEQSGKPLSNPVWARKRVIGGTTTVWGGQSLPFSSIDFQPRDWVASSGWPITHVEIAQYYAAANQFMCIDACNYDTDLFKLLKRPDPGFDRSRLHYHFSKWAPEPNFLNLYRRKLERNVVVLYNAQLVRIDLGESGLVSEIVIENFAGQAATIPVGTLILATGGIETNRILLLADHQVRGGLGNHSGWLGKAFMEHPCLEAGYVEPYNMRLLQQTFGTHVHRSRKYSVRLSAAQSWQREQRLLNVSASILCRYPDGEADPLGCLKRFAQQPRPESAVCVARNCGRISQSLWALAKDGFVYKPGSLATLVFMAEQEPTTRSQIALSNRTDRFGARLARLNWVITEKTWDTVKRFANEIALEMERLQLGRVMLHPHLRTDATNWEDYFTDVNHHMGGTRMSAIPAEGVVNDQLQLWGVPNLYVCSTSVFPTSSHSNCTLTLLALGMRLAAKLTTTTRQPWLA